MAFKFVLRAKKKQERSSSGKEIHSKAKSPPSEMEGIIVRTKEETAEQNTQYEIIIKWPKSDWPKKAFEYQRMGFKYSSNFSEAAIYAESLVKLLALAARSNDQMRDKLKPKAYVIALYLQTAYKDWSSEPYNKADPSAREHAKNLLADIKANKGKNTKKLKAVKPISYVDLEKASIVR